MRNKISAFLVFALICFVTTGCVSSQVKEENEKLKTELSKSKQKEAELEKKIKEEEERYKKDCQTLSDGLNKEMDNGQISINKVKGGITVNMADRLFFDTGKADIKASGKKLLNRFAENLKKMQDKIVRVDGHTDNAPIMKNSELYSKYPTNWELGAARAINVTRYLTEKCGINPAIISASTYSFYQPADTNDTKQGKAKNRRIEIIVMDKDLLNYIKPVKEK